MSDPSSGVAHPVFFPAGRLDPVVTLTPGIDMYLIRPFPRPQFSRGPWPQLLPLRGPSSRSRGAISPSNPPLGQQRSTAGSQRFERYATTRRSRTERPETQRSPPGSARRRAARHQEGKRANRHPAAHGREPAQRPDLSRTRDDGPPRRPRGARAHAPRSHGARNGATIETTNQTQGPRSRPKSSQPRQDVPPDGCGAELPRRYDHGGRTAAPRHPTKEAGARIATTPRMTTSAFIDDPTGTTHSPHDIQRPHLFDGNEHHESSARRARRAAAGADIQRDIRPLPRRWKS